jgi:hypothetical protein
VPDAVSFVRRGLAGAGVDACLHRHPNVLPVPGDQPSTRPVSTRSGNASTVTRAGLPIRTRVICVSLKFAITQMFGNGIAAITCVPTLTNCPGRT